MFSNCCLLRTTHSCWSVYLLNSWQTRACKHQTLVAGYRMVSLTNFDDVAWHHLFAHSFFLRVFSFIIKKFGLSLWRHRITVRTSQLHNRPSSPVNKNKTKTCRRITRLISWNRRDLSWKTLSSISWSQLAPRTQYARRGVMSVKCAAMTSGCARRKTVAAICTFSSTWPQR